MNLFPDLTDDETEAILYYLNDRGEVNKCSAGLFFLNTIQHPLIIIFSVLTR